MFVKLTRRPLRRQKTTELQFSIVEGYRADDKVKHRTMLWVYSIPEIFLTAPAWLNLFWQTVEYKLAQAANISAVEKQ